ncbi:MAG TPA: cytochrome c maturation protein CcmE [Anaerolineae bacterium]|nr:cytochrome c maturation protein CcmE [Anaerolineae bacterium]
MSPKLKFLIGGLVVVTVIAALIASSFGGTSSDYLTIAQVRALGPDQARDSRVAGAIVANSVVWSTSEVRLTFDIQDETGRLSVSYRGPQPDMLVDAVEAVAIGKYNPAKRVFEADELLMKCPSKYEEKQ